MLAKKLVISAAVAGVMLASAAGAFAFHGFHIPATVNSAVVGTVTTTGANTGDNLQVGRNNTMTTGAATAATTVSTVVNSNDGVMGNITNGAHVGTTTTTGATTGDNTQTSGSHHHHMTGANTMTTGAATATGTVVTVVNTNVSSDSSL